jgi:hypothetical protein
MASQAGNLNLWKHLLNWLCVVTPWLLLSVGLSLAVHVKIGLGHWPEPMTEEYSTTAFQGHFRILQACFVMALYSLAPTWKLLLCARRFRVSFRFHALQAAVYGGGWLVILLICQLDPWRFMQWLAD